MTGPNSKQQPSNDETTKRPHHASTIDLSRTEQTMLSGEGNGVPSPSNVDIAEGSQLGKYEVRRLLGRGAMGAVFLAFDPMIEREVAIKVLPVDIAERPQALDRFLTEARSTGRLNHPNIVSIYDIAEQDGQYYIVMEVLTGGSLADQTVDGRSVNWKDACRMIADAAEGLSAAHAAGLVHRDIKPDNLMMTGDGVVKVVDFGLSKLVDAKSDTRDATTQHGTILGTPQYMSPEQCESAAVDSRSDIYSLGGTLFRLLTGRHPYEEIASVLQVMMAHAAKPIPDPLLHNPDLPEACRTIVTRAMAKDPTDRYQDAAEMSAELKTLIYSSDLAHDADRKDRQYQPLESVIILEPSKMQALMQKDAFTAAGVSIVESCGDATAAKSLVESVSPDVVISAMQLPDGRGIELFSDLRSTEAGRDRMHVLNSSDFTLVDLIDLGQTGPLALVSRKTRPDEIIRSIHACTWLNVATGPLTEPIDPTGSGILVVCDSDRIPAPIAELVRRLNLLDLQITTFDDLANGFVPSSKVDLALAVRTAGIAEKDTALYAGLLTQVNLDVRAVAALQVDGDDVTLRAIRRGGFSAVTSCVLDDVRLTRLIQVIQK